MGRSTVYNKNLTSDEKWNKVLENNKVLFDEFIEYCKSSDRSKETIKVYINGLKIYFCWNLELNKNKFFIDLTIKDIIKYQNFLNDKDLSPSRIRLLKSSLSSLSNYIELVESDTYKDFRNIINKVPAPAMVKVREKLILDSDQVYNILNLLIDNHMIQQAACFALSAFSGSRKSELSRFRIIDFKEKNVKNGLYCSDNKIKTKGRGNRGKLLTKYTIKKEFKPYLDLWLKEREKLNISSEWLFVKNNQPVKLSTLNYWAEQISNITGINFYFHSMRHFFTTSLCKNNIPAEIIKTIIGWENLEMINIYSDLKTEDQFGDYFSEDGIKYIEKKTSII